MSTPHPEDPIDAARDLLSQLQDLAVRIGTGTWCAPHPALGDATIGQHVRHCLDHVEQLAEGAAGSGEVDYDARCRDTADEIDPVAAVERAAALASRVTEVAAAVPAVRPMQVRSACSPTGDVEFQPTTFGRELRFVIGHTVHHLAMIAALGRLHGLVLPADVGVAASTSRYRTESSR